MSVDTTSVFLSKTFDVGDLPVLTFGNCVLKTGVITCKGLWNCTYFLRFFSKSTKKHDFLRFLSCCTRFLEHWFDRQVIGCELGVQVWTVEQPQVNGNRFSQPDSRSTTWLQTQPFSGLCYSQTEFCLPALCAIGQLWLKPGRYDTIRYEMLF